MEVSRYDSVADWYLAWVDASPWVHRVIMHHRACLGMGLPPGSRVLDLGCGEGLFSRVLERDGYQVVGIDLSERLVDAARMRGPDTIAFVVDDAQTLISQGTGSFDGALCVLALMDIPDIGAVFQAAHRVVRPGGTFACVLMHPAFDGPGARWLEIESQAGVVTLRGVVRSFYQRQLCIHCCQRVAGVHRVQDELEVASAEFAAEPAAI